MLGLLRWAALCCVGAALARQPPAGLLSPAPMIDLHMCPHSHLDVGFDASGDNMFSKNNSGPMGKKSVGIMMDAVVEALLEDPRRTYNMAGADHSMAPAFSCD